MQIAVGAAVRGCCCGCEGDRTEQNETGEQARVASCMYIFFIND